MIRQFNQTLFIARSSESAELYLSQHTGAIKAITLSSLLSSEEFRSSVAIDVLIGKMVLRRAIESLSLVHFDYLSCAEASIGEVYAHILNCKRNRVGLDLFGYDHRKHTELARILTAYEELKSSLGLKDSADVMIEEVASLRNTDYFTQFSKVVVDVFEEEGVRFYSCALEREALEIIYTLDNIEILHPQSSELNTITTYTPLPSRFDEALFAIKAARKLMDDNVADTDIAIVTGNLGNYRRVIESYAAKYGMQFRFSSGILMFQSPLFSEFLSSKSFDVFKASFAERLKQDYEQGLIDEHELGETKQQFNQIKKLHLRTLGIIETAKKLFASSPDYKETITSLAQETYIPPLKDQAGIWVSEPNQIPNRQFKHMIFIGTDLSQFPPKTRGNFLSTPQQREEYFWVDNSYRLSQYYFAQMLKNSQSIHLSTALQEGKKKLFLSPIISNLPQQSFKDYEYVSEREILHTQARFVQDEKFEKYIDATQCTESTPYDGKCQTYTFESGVLSASSLNEYAKCPLRYQLTFQYKAEALAIERDDDDLEASDIGTIFHSIAEQFAKDVKKKTIILDKEPTSQIKEHLHTIAVEKHQEYIQKHIVDEGKTPNIFHEIVLHDLIKGLFEEHHERGLLVRFLDYVYESGRLEHFDKSEERFMLDGEFNITSEKDKAMVKGFIDRIDRDELTVTVLDYKTGKYGKDKETKLIEGMSEYTQFQLPLYLLYASQAYSDYTINAYLLSMRHDKGTKDYAHVSNNAENGLLFDDAYATGLKEKIRYIKHSIEAGVFAMTPSEDNCSYCPYERICHKDLFAHKWKDQVVHGDDNV
ncbi:PD-(D/E)XK nuclease family protein [Sulfuricurvum sp.]|uniref:PD-(D/E)XK nuclease family protein n=1 Tax=Sulfuricurvum sp. TaxID=2025608 RepID=UPI00260F7522|nr:PD-(D/E)XK nuclease family protein [Sulfuricurvum sp.]MDD3596499.1 PD-(D/E)XK nuclease family protein [Sulfuricurvum sp.]